MVPWSDVGWVFVYVAAFGFSDYLVETLNAQAPPRQVHVMYLLYAYHLFVPRS
jgi:hypothetical protein